MWRLADHVPKTASRAVADPGMEPQAGPGVEAVLVTAQSSPQMVHSSGMHGLQPLLAAWLMQCVYNVSGPPKMVSLFQSVLGCESKRGTCAAHVVAAEQPAHDLVTNGS